MAGNGVEQPQIQAKTVPAIRISIEWAPSVGQLQIGWPEVDDVIKLGLLEMAKMVLVEGRAKAGMSDGGGLIVPGRLRN